MSTELDGDNTMYVPWVGTYVAFSFDIEKTIDVYNCDPDYATLQALRRHPCQTFVGYCTNYEDLPIPEGKYNRIGIRPLQHGFISPVPELCITEDMCVAVHPETKHPDPSRLPVEVNKPLPWSSCYHGTCADIIVRAPTDIVDYTDSYRMSLKDRLQLQSYMIEDEKKRSSAYEAQHAASESRTSHPIDDRGEENLKDATMPVDHEPQENLVAGFASSRLIRRCRSDADLLFRSTQEYLEASRRPLRYHSTGSIDNAVAVDIDSEEYSDSGYLNAYDDEDFDVPIEDDRMFTAVIKFTPDLSSVKTLVSEMELCSELKALERIVMRCREGLPYESVLSLSSDPLHHSNEDKGSRNRDFRTIVNRIIGILQRTRRAFGSFIC